MADPINIIIVGKDQTGAAFKSVRMGMQGVAESARGTLTKGLKVAGAAFIGLGAAGAAGVAGLSAGIIKMTLDASAIEGVADTFESLAHSINAEAEPALQLMRDATRGMVADADLLQAGNKFMAMGLAESQEEMAKLSEIATQLGSAMGEGPTESMENFALMLANQSIPRLDSFGISSGKVRERIDELMEANEGLTRETAFMQAVMEQAEVTMAKVGEQGATSAASIARIQSTVQNTALGIGREFIPVLKQLLVPVADLAQKVGPQLVEWAGMLAAWLGDRLPIAIDWIIHAFDSLVATIEPVIGAFMDFIRYIRFVVTDGDVLNDWLTHLPEPLQGIAETIGRVIVAFDNFWAVLRDYGPISAIAEVLDNFIPEEQMSLIWDIADAVKQLISIVAGGLVNFIDLKDVLLALGIGIASIILPAVVGLVSSFIAIVGPIIAVVAAVALLRDAWQEAGGNLKEFVGVLVDKISGVWQKVSPILAEWGVRIWDWLTQIAIPLAVEKIGQFASNIISELIAAWPGISDTLLGWADGVWAWLTEIAIPLAAEKIGNFVSSITSALAEAWPGIQETLLEWGDGTWNWLTQIAIPAAVEKINEFADTVSGELEKVWPKIEMALMEWGPKAWAWLTEAAIPQAGERMNELAQAIMTWAEGPEGKAAGEAIGEAIVDGMVAAIGALVGGGFLAGKMQGAFGTIPGQLADFTATMGANIVSGIVNAIAEKLGIQIPKPVSEGLQAGLEQAFALLNPAAFLRKMVKDTVKALKELVKVFKMPFSEIWKTVKGVLDKIKKLWHKLFGNSELLDSAYKFGQELVRTFVSFLAGVYSEILDFAAKALKAFVDLFKQIIADAVQFGRDLIREFVTFLRGILDEVERWARDTIREFLDTFREILSSAIQFGRDMLREFIEFLGSILSEVVSWGRDLLREFGETFSDILSNAIEFGRNMVNEFIAFLGSILSEVASWGRDLTSSFTSTLGDILDAVVSWGRDMVSNFASVLGEIIDEVISWGANLYQTFRQQLEALAQVPAEIAGLLRQIGADIIQFVIDGIQAVTDFVSRVVDQLTTWFNEVYSNILAGFQAAIDIGKLIALRISEGLGELTTFVSNVVSQLSSWIGQIANNAAGVANDLIDEAKRVGTKIADWFVDGIRGVGDFASRIKDWILEQLRTILGLHSVSIPEMSMRLGAAIAESIVDGFVSQPMARRMKDAVEQWARAASGATLDLAPSIGRLPVNAAGIGGTAIPAMATAASTTTTTTTTTNNLGGITLAPVISDQVDAEEFYYRVEEVVREMIG